MPLIQWIMDLLDDNVLFDQEGSGGIVVGGEASTRIPKTNHIGSGGASGDGSATVTIIPGKVVLKFFKKVRFFPGDRVYDDQGRQYVVIEMLFAGSPGPCFMVARDGKTRVFRDNELSATSQSCDLPCDGNFHQRLACALEPATRIAYIGKRKIFKKSQSLTLESIEQRLARVREPSTTVVFPGIRKMKVKI